MDRKKNYFVRFWRKVKEVRDASTYVRPGVEGVVIDVKVFSRKPDALQRRGDWTQDDPTPLIQPDSLRYDSKRKQIEEDMAGTGRFYSLSKN